MFKIARPIAAVVVSASMLLSTPGFSAGIGGISTFGERNVAPQNLTVPIHHKRHKRRNPKPGEVIAGAILLGILGVAVASGSRNHYNDQYTTAHENRVKAATKACRKSARKWFRKKFHKKPRVNTLHVTYKGKKRYDVDGIVSNRNDRNRYRFHCKTRKGKVRKFRVNR